MNERGKGSVGALRQMIYRYSPAADSLVHRSSFIISAMPMADDVLIHNVKFDERGLIPAIVQDAGTLEVVALVYLDNARLAKTLQTGETRFLVDLQATADLSDYRLLDVRVNPDGGSLTVLIERQTGEALERETISLMQQF